MTSGHDTPFFFRKNPDIPPPWEAAAQRFLEAGGVALVLGGPDTGKSTLCRYLVYRAYVAGEPAALVDLDLGQSHLGPPGTLGLGLFPPRFPGDQSLFPEALYFIGQTSPLGAILEVAVGSRILVDEARARGVDRVVVNTSGFIHGPGAHRLKKAEAELLQPRLLLALEEKGELAPLLRTLGGGEKTLSLPVSSQSVPKGLEQRRHYREARFRRYFEQARPLELSLQELSWQGPPFGWGTPLSPGEFNRWSEILGEKVLYGVSGHRRPILLLDRPPGEIPPHPPDVGVTLLTPSALTHRLVGLWDADHRTLALGLLLESPWELGQLAVLTPLPAAQGRRVRTLSLGRLQVSPSGRELRGLAGC